MDQATLTVHPRKVQDPTTELARTVSETARRDAVAGRTETAVRLLRDALELVGSELQPQDQALLMADLGGMIWKQGQFQEACSLVEQATRLADVAGGRHSLATALYHRGELAYVKAFLMQEGELEGALAYHARCLALRRELGDLTGVTVSLSRIGVLYERLQHHDIARAFYEESLELARETGYAAGMIRPYTHIGGYYRRGGDWRTAWSFYRKALTIAQATNCYEEIAFGLCNVGRAFYRLDRDAETSQGYLQRALHIAQGIDFKLAICRAYHGLAELSLDEGERQQARYYYEQLAQLSSALGYQAMLRQALHHLDSLAQSKGLQFVLWLTQPVH